MKVVIITGNKYPCGDAGAVRQHATAKMFKALGHEVLVLGYGDPNKNSVKEYEGILYETFRPNSKNILVRGIYRYLFIDRVSRYMDRKFKGKKIDWILAVDFFPRDYKTIAKIARRYHAGLIHDSVEWYSPEEFSDGVKNRSYRDKEYTNTVAVGKGWRVMAISSYLEEHFSKRCDKTVRIPVIMDIDAIESNLRVSNADKIRFSYVGAPGRKDYLKEIIEGFAMLSDDQLKKVELNIVGVDLHQLESVCGVEKESITKLKDTMVAHGRLPHNEAIKFVREADYTLLFRDASLRYAKAGFPTKIVESLACGTPPVCNLSSDLGMYLRNEENAIIAGGHSPEAVKNAVERALSISAEKRVEIRHQARKTAEQCFDYKNYVSEIETLIN